MNNIKAAPLIHSRTAFCDFRSNFLCHPKAMSQIQIDRLKEVILQSTHSMEELHDEGGLRKIIYSEDDYIVFGITAYLKDIYAINNETDNKVIFSEERARPTYAFIGFVFGKTECSDITSFPKIENFISAVERYIVPRWNEKRHSDDVDTATLTDYNSNIVFEDSKYVNSCELNISSSEKVKIFNTKESEHIISASIQEVSKGKKVSVCTNLAYKSDAEKSFFMNVSCRKVDVPITCNNGNSLKDNGRGKDKPASELYLKDKIYSEQYSYDKNATFNKKKKESSSGTKKLTGHLVKAGIIIASGAYLIFAAKKTAALIILSAGVGMIALISEVSVLIKDDTDKSKRSFINNNNINNLSNKSSSNKVINSNVTSVDPKSDSDEDIFKL